MPVIPFEEFLERTIALHTLSGEPASLLMIDMDKFKVANDTFGHDVGDVALRTVGDCLARVFLRRCDLVCRWGGDEFAVLLTETPSVKAATSWLQRADPALYTAKRSGGGKVNVAGEEDEKADATTALPVLVTQR